VLYETGPEVTVAIIRPALAALCPKSGSNMISLTNP
jgi:hypothetical protein